MSNWFDEHPLLRQVAEILRQHHIEAYLVGGAVRDLLLGRPEIDDLDFAVPVDGLHAARAVADALAQAYYPLDAERGTGRVVYEADDGGAKRHLDFATFRGVDLEADLRDRDFTLNAMALSLTAPPAIIDLLGGQQDLEAGVLRAVSSDGCRNDPVRVLRAIRQAADFDFAIEDHTRTYVRAAAPELSQSSLERQRDELVKLLNSARPGQAVRQLDALGITPYLLPEIGHAALAAAPLDAWRQLLDTNFPPFADHHEALNDYLSQLLAGEITVREVVPLAILLQRTPRQTSRVLKRFRFSSQATQFVTTMVDVQPKIPTLWALNVIERRDIYHFFQSTNSRAGATGVAALLQSLVTASVDPAPAAAYRLLSAYFTEHDSLIEPSPLLTGQELIRILGLTPGPLIGHLLRQLKEAQAIGQVTDTESALALIRSDPAYIEAQSRDNKEDALG